MCASITKRSRGIAGSATSLDVNAIPWLVLVLIAGCQSTDKADKADQAASAPAATAPATPTAPAPGGGPAPTGAAYKADIGKLCDVVSLSGAAGMEAGDRSYTIAQWLPANLTTPESKQFLVKIQPLVGNAKAAALEDEAKRVGLPGCALAAEWRTP